MALLSSILSLMLMATRAVFVDQLSSQLPYAILGSADMYSMQTLLQFVPLQMFTMQQYFLQTYLEMGTHPVLLQ